MQIHTAANGSNQNGYKHFSPDADTHSNFRVSVRDLNVFYDSVQALHGISLDISAGEVTALIGPSGCGKSTFLRTLNRMNDLIPGTRIEGRVELDGQDILHENIDILSLRRKVGMVFQKSNPFPKSIFENIAWGPRIHGMRDKLQLEELVQRCLEKADLWNEVKDRLRSSALNLSGGQQQRLCIARALSVDPEILLMDEPASALDPKSTAKIEELIAELRGSYTIIIVTHNMQQAKRVSDQTAFFCEGQLVEFGATSEIFKYADQEMTRDYLSGAFG